MPVHTGSYAVTFDVAGGQNYKSAGGFEYGTLNIGKADGDPAYIISKVSTVKNGSVELKNYVTGAAGEVSFLVKTALAGCSLDQDTGILTTGDTTGDCVVTVTMGESADYKGKTAEITVSVTNKLMQNMSFAIPENGKVYGDEDFSATVEGASTEVNYAVAEGNDVVSIDSDTGLVHIIKAGSATITATAAESDEYVAAVRSLKLEIGRKSVTVKAEDKSKNMGEDDPELTAVVSGLVAGESETLINYSLSREGGEAGGEYAITAVGNTIQGNYTVNYVAGTLTIIDNTVYPAVMTSAPEAVGNLCADGSARALVSPGSAEGGTIMYALGIDDHTIPAADKFSGSVPTGTEAGTYYVWYKIIGDESHLDTEAKCITVVIKEAEPEPEPEQPVHMHTLVHHVRVEATVEAEGSIEYWECTECKKLYADEEATKEISAEDIVIPKLKPETETAAPAAPVTVTEIIGEVPVTINMDVVYPKAVTWTGKRITKDQLAVLAENGELAKVDISGLAEAVKTLKPGTDISKLYKLSYLISRDKDVSKGKAYFTMKLTLKGSAVKKAGIKGNDRKALQQLIKRFNEQLKEKKYYYDIVPINLKDAESVSIKAKPVAGQLQVNEDGTLKGLKSLKIKVKIKGVKKIKTYSFSAKKAAKTFDMRVSDPAAGTVTIIAKNGTGFAGSRAATGVKK